MSQMLHEPAELTPRERRLEVAAVLARGVLRLRQCSPTPPFLDAASATGKTSESRRD